MGDQLEKIIQSSGYIKNKFPKNFKPEAGLVIEKDLDVLKDFRIISEIDFADVPEFEINSRNNFNKITFAKIKGCDVVIYKGRSHFFDGVPMRNIGHLIYVLKNLGIKKIVSIDEVGHLNPRYGCGDLALIYDHINLMGDNPLIGKNENELGVRFPDMSNAYDKEMHRKIYEVMQDEKFIINDAVYLGITGPESETDAEARFYRDTGADVLGYSIVPENIAAVHCGIKFAAIGLITRNLVADIMMEDERSEKQKIKEQKENLKSASRKLGKIMEDVFKKV